MEIDRLQISISADASKAIKEYGKLANALQKLQSISKSDMGFKKLSDQINEFADATKGAVETLERLANAMEKIHKAGNGGFVRATNNLKKVTEFEQAEAQPFEPEQPIDNPSGWVDHLADSLDNVTKSAKKATGGWLKFIKAIGKIVLYRIIRRILSEISKAIEEGTKNFYTFLNAADSAYAKSTRESLDKISSAFMVLGNQVGATLLQFLVSIEPAVTALAKALTYLAQGISIVIGALNGSNKYWKANADAVKKWDESVNHALQNFDELNVLSSNMGETSPFEMFTEEDIDENTAALIREISAVVAVVAAYALLSSLISKIMGLFNGKNSILKKQTGLTDKEGESVLGLASNYEFAFDDVTEFAGALEGLAGAGVIGAIAGLVTSFGDVESQLGEVTTGLQTVYDGIADATSSAVTKAIESVTAQFDAMYDSVMAIPNALHNVLSNFSTFVGEIKSGFAKIGEYASSWINPITGFLDTLASFVSNFSFGSTNVPTGDYEAPTYEIIPKDQLPVNKTKEALDWFNLVVGGGFAASSVGSAVSAIASALASFLSGGSIPMYASGGFVDSGEIFMSRENGIPEMVGRIGNRTAVANNDQITEAIASAVYDAMMSANQGGSVQVVLEGDAKKLFNVVQKEARSYSRATGNYAF